MWRNEEKAVFFRAEKLEKTLRQKGKSPLPADKVRYSIKPMWQNEEKIVFSEHKNWKNGSPMEENGRC